MRLLLIAALATGCSAFEPGTINGRVESTGEAGAWVMTKGSCTSGERENYFGVLALAGDDSGAGIKIVKDQIRGWTAVVNVAATCKKGAPGACQAVVLSAENCTTFKADAGTTHTTINSIKVVEGFVELDCNVNDGAIKGKLTFSYCH